MFAITFEVDGIANYISRQVWNIEEALGYIGGIFALVEIIISIIVAPFGQDNLILAMTKQTKAGKQMQVNSLRFYLKRCLENIFCGIQIFSDDEFKN